MQHAILLDLQLHCKILSSMVGAPGVVEVDGDPGGDGAVDIGQVLLEPDVLGAALGVVYIVAEEDVVAGAHICGVVEV